MGCGKVEAGLIKQRGASFGPACVESVLGGARELVPEFPEGW